MPTEKIQLGADAVLKIDGTEVDDATDVNVNIGGSMLKLPTRKTAKYGWSSSSPGLSELSIDFTLLKREGSTMPDILRAAKTERTILEVEALDCEGGEGPSGDFYVAEFGRGEPLQDGIAFKVKLEWTSDGGQEQPEWSGA